MGSSAWTACSLLAVGQTRRTASSQGPSAWGTNLVGLLGWGAGNGTIWALLGVFQVCDPFLACVGLVLVQFQRWLSLQRQIRRRVLGWKCAGEQLSRGEVSSFDPSLSRHRKGQSDWPPGSPGARAGRSRPERGCRRRAGPGQAGGG